MCQVPLDFDLFVAQKVCSRPSHNGVKSCLKDKSFFFTCVFMIFYAIVLSLTQYGNEKGIPIYNTVTKSLVMLGEVRS